jgi:hypothetical protein
MPTFSLTDDIGQPVDNVKVDWTSASSLFRYLRSQVLHLIVVPDYLDRRTKPLAEAAPQPIDFLLKVGNKFELGGENPEIAITPTAQVIFTVNTTEGSNLFVDDPFRADATVPQNTGYVGLSVQGTLDAGVSTIVSSLGFGFDANKSITIGFWKAFSLDNKGPELGDATGKMISGFVIPGKLADLRQLQEHDICEVAGSGSLGISATFSVNTLVNPLASVNLPLNTGKINVTAGVIEAVSASCTISGAYRIRLRNLGEGKVELSILKDRGATLQAGFSASAGVSATLGDRNLIASLLGAIGKDTPDPNLLAGLSVTEAETFTRAIAAGIDHNLRASVNLTLSQGKDNQAIFQYELQPALLAGTPAEAVEHALKGDFSKLVDLEKGMDENGVLAPGVKLINNVFSTARSRGLTLRVNLLGIVNLISLSRLIRKCEVLTDPAAGDVTIKETVASQRISAITIPLARQEMLRKALFDSVMVTTTYRASNSIAMPGFSSDGLHFAVNQNTNAQTLSDYLNWFVALDLMRAGEKAGIASGFRPGGPSTCLMRTELNDADCRRLFFRDDGSAREESEYVEIDRFRYEFLDNDDTWRQAVDMGPSPALRTLLPVSSSDARFNVVLEDVSGDLYDVVWWAKSMVKAAAGIEDMQSFLAGRDPATLADDPEFTRKREGLQKLMAGVVKDSKVRFHEPWGMLCLFRASGGRQASGKLAAGNLIVDRAQPLEIGIVAGR